MSIGEEQVECPLCMEPLELDDINFYPCTCGYQICRFCWNRIRTDENGLCPACRKSYPEDPAAFKPLTEDELQRIKRERKMKDLQRKQKAAENRKHLANVRVVQRNLVFAVGLSQRLADTEVLKKHDYFGKFGKIVKVVINQSTSYAGSQGPSASAYITYQKAEDALRAIQAVNNIHVDGRTIKASLGTTKYCSHFLRGTQCPKPDCMYLHELGDEAASFTKEEMQQGKHQEYEQKLYEQYMNQLNSINATNQTTQPPPPQQQQPQQQQPQTSKTTTNQTRKKTHSPATTQRQTPPQSASQNHTDAWPSLQTGGQQPTQSKPSTDRTTNGTTKGLPTSHSNLSNSFGSSTTTTSSSSSSSNNTGTTHKRNLSSDLHNRTAAAGGGGGSSQHRQTRTPDPHTTNRVQHSVTEGNCTQSQQQHQAHNNQHHQTNTPTPPQSLVNNCTPPQLSPPQIQTPPSQVTRQTPNVGSPKSPQPLAPQRKPLYGDSNTESLSLFSNSGFPINRHPLKHPGLQTAAFAAPPVTGGQDSKLNGPEIPDTISVSSSTDWQAAFGFQPSPMLSSHGIVDNGQKATSSRVLPQQTNHHNSVQDSNADDDLGFDPWNESTKALQDLIEKEAVSAASGHQPHPRHPLHHHPLAAQHQLNPLQQQRYQLAQQQMLGQEQTKPLPPGFTHNHLVLGGSRMMGVSKFGQSSSYPPPQHNGTGGMESLSDLALCGPLPRHGGPESFNMKSWQEGLRALLPNINIHFGGGGAANTTPLQGPVPPLMNNINPPAAGASGLPQQSATQPANQKTVQPQKSPQNSWDLTSDPAVLTSGNIADGPEEPHWMASLHHLTEDTAPSQQQHPAPLQQNLPYGSSRLLPLGLRHNPQTAGGAPFITPQPTAPPPGFQNSIRPPPHLASGMLESHKQLMDAFQ